MKRTHIALSALVGAGLLGLVVLPGCSPEGPQPAPTSASGPATPPSSPHGAEHGHKAGQFGGIIVPIGRALFRFSLVFRNSAGCSGIRHPGVGSRTAVQ